MNDAVATIGASREHRVAELADAARREHIVADALAALANTIEVAEIPVAQYAPIWEAVANRLRRDAGMAERRAIQAVAHVDDVQAAIDARARWSQR